MDQAPLYLEYRSELKELIWHDIRSKIDERLDHHLSGAHLLSLVMPSAESKDQLAAVVAICREVEAQLADFDKRSSYQSSINTLSRPACLMLALKEEQAQAHR